MTIRVLLADDQELVRAGLRAVFEVEPDIEVVAEAADGQAALDGAREHQPDVVLMDVRMPRMDGLVATKQLLADSDPPKVRRLVETVVAGRPAVTPPPGFDELTAREREVLVQVAQGRSNAEIAEMLFLGPATVKTHVSRVLTKLGLRDRIHAVIAAYESGLVSPGRRPP